MNNPSSEVDQLDWRIVESAADGMLIADLETAGLLASNPATAEMHRQCGRPFSSVNMSLRNFPGALQTAACHLASANPHEGRRRR